MTPDVNVLVATLRPDHPHHAVASAWLESATVLAAAGARFNVMPMLIASYLRLVTSAKISVKAAALTGAISAVINLFMNLGSGFGNAGKAGNRVVSAARTLHGQNFSGNTVPDAWLAAATLQIGEPLVTFDRNFKKTAAMASFDGVLVPNS